MRHRDHRFTREQLLSVARAYGFSTRVGQSSSTQAIEDFLLRKGLTEQEIIEKTKAVRIAAKPMPGEIVMGNRSGVYDAATASKWLTEQIALLEADQAVAA